MEKKKKKPILFMGLLVAVFLVIGATIAYYTSTDTFNNEFNAANYEMEVEETFESPDNWTPGTTTPKEIIATNKGNTPAAVRIKLTPSWVDENGDPLPLTVGANEAAIINFASDKDYKWIYQDGYYYYIRPLDENESTSTLINSVTFNPAISFNNTRECETVNGITTCTTEFNDYSGGKYTLKIEVETAQYNKYRDIWNTYVNINNPEKKAGTLKQMTQFSGANAYGNEFHDGRRKGDIEIVTFLDVINIPYSALETWDCSDEQNESVMCWIVDKDSNGKFELYIGQEGGVIANANSEGAISYFDHAKEINVEHLDTSNATTMKGMFYYSGYTGNVEDSFVINGLDKWDTSNVTDMSNMFKYTGRSATNWSIGRLDNFNTSKVTNMESMFDRPAYLAKSFDIGNIGNWDVSNVTNMASMFDSAGYNSKYWSIGDLSNWDTRKVTTMSSMFAEAGKDATTWNSIGTLKVYATDIFRIMSTLKNAKATINIYSNPTEYTFAFNYAAKTPGSLVTVNYTNSVTDIDNIIATKSDDSNVVKGSIIN